MDKSQTKEINYKHLKPINIILNPKFESGELQEQGLYQPITIYDKPIQPEKLKDSNEDFLQEVNGLLNRKDFDEDNGYTKNSRVISPQDGIMYYYSKNKGQINARLEGGQIMNFSKIKMLICVTMYAEDRKMLEKTLKGIQKNVRNFNLQYNISPEQIVVVVLQDGIMKMQEEMVDFFCEKDIKRWNKQGLDEQQREISKKDTVKRRRQLINYENNLYKNPKTGKNQRVDLNNGLPPSLPKKIALLYQEQENFFPLDSDFDNFPLTCLYLHKHLNAKKLSSHLWFFEGFCRQFQPKYCAFIDVGTIPNEFGLVKYFEALEGDQNIGGVSGFLGIEQEKSQRELKEEEEMDQKILTQSEQEWIKEGYFEVKYYQDGGKEVIVQQKQTNQEQKKDFLTEKQKQEKEEEQKLLVQKQKYANKNRKRLLRCSFLLIFPIIYYIFYYLILGITIVIKYIIQSIKSLFFYLFNTVSLENAQLFEYTISHIIDKNFESYLGFLHVLPGAWSAYRYDALAKGNLYRENLLQKRYLKQILNPGLGVGDYKEANMYLAEDRILCLGIFCQVNSNYSLKYIPDAVAETDPVQTFEEFLNQRRRWINSSWFALEYVLRNYATDLEFSAHNMWTKTISLPFNMLVAQLGQLNMYYLLGLYLFVVCTIFSQLVNALAVQFNSDIKDFEDLNKFYENHKYLYVLPWLLVTIYILTLLTMVFLSLTFKIKSVKGKENYNSLSDDQKMQLRVNNSARTMSGFISCFGFFTFLGLLALGFIKVFSNKQLTSNTNAKTQKFVDKFTLFVIICNIAVPAVLVIIHLFTPAVTRRAWHIIKSTCAYLFYSATYFNTLVIFSFCNIDDVTWGTKGITSGEVNDYYLSKIQFVSSWIFQNSLLCFLLVLFNSLTASTQYFLFVIFGYAALYIFIKVFFATFYHFRYFCHQRGKNRKILNQRKNERYSIESKYTKQQFLDQDAIIEKDQNLYNILEQEIDPKTKNISQLIDILEEPKFKLQLGKSKLKNIEQIRQFSQEYSYLNLSQLKENNLLASQLKLNQSQLQQFNKNNLNNLNTSQNLKGKQNSGQSQNTSQNQNQNQNYPQSQSPRNLQREKQGIVLEEDSEEEESKHNLFDDKNKDKNQEEEDKLL